MNARVPVAVVCALLIVAVAALDVFTPQRLVAAILLNVPVALSGLAYSRRVTAWLVVAAVTANVVAGVLNAQTEGGLDGISLLNRALLAASFALVGWMSVTLSQTASRLTHARAQEVRLRRERDRERVAGIGQERSLGAALERAALVLAEGFGARGVLLATGGTRVFGAPRASVPGALASWVVGSPLPARLLGAPLARPVAAHAPSEYGLNANRAVIGGVEWGDRAPLLIALLEPSGTNLEDTAGDLEELLPGLRDALERADLSERLESNRTELERRAGVIRDLVYAFSHDLRTPLTANVMNMRLALEGAFGQLPQPYRDTLSNGIQANEDLLALADSLLYLARLESNELPRPKERVALEAAARSSAARLAPSVPVTWTVRGDTTVLGEPGDLRRAIQNLLENAARHSPPGAGLDLSLTRDAEHVHFEVADRGTGVPTDLEPRLFQRFSTGRAGGGTGLGLYLARRIVEAHGGRIGYRPRVGGGSVFWLELPAAPTETA